VSLNDDLLKDVHCRNCQHATRHRAATLDKIFLHLPQSARDVLQINYACPSCKHLGLADVDPDLMFSEALYQTSTTDDTAAFLVLLECEKQNCRSRVSVFAPMEPGTHDSQVKSRVSLWIDDGAKCQEGRPLWKPYHVCGITRV